MDLIQALLLGIVQGLTEFFPVSSSAHLKFARFLFGLSEGDHWLYFDLSCHFGTWCALCLCLRAEIAEVLRTPRLIALYFLALLPLVPAYFLLKPLREALSSPEYTGYFLLATAALLAFASKKREKEPDSYALKYRDVLSIGMMQSLALLPGLSRSGSTIAAGRLLGLSWSSAARFSFLLAVPTILGGEMLETWKLIKHSSSQAGPSFACTALGSLSSFATGLLSVRFVFRIYEKGNPIVFALYCALFGTILLSVFRG